MTCIETMVQNYLNHLANERRVTAKSLSNYRSTCTKFVQWATENKRGLDSESLQSYVQRYDNASSANVVLVRLTGLAKFANTSVKVTRAKEDVREIEALTSKEVYSLIEEAFDQSDECGYATQLLTETGLRFEEFCNATVDHVVVRGGNRFLKVNGKGRKERFVPLTPLAWTALQNLPERNAGFEKRFRQELAQAGEDANIAIHCHPHLMRSSFISIHLNEKGTQAIIVAKIVGHSSVDTMLKHYFRASFDTLAAAM